MKLIYFNAEIEKLLTTAKLPSSDLVGADKVVLFGHEQKGKVVGLVGIEKYDQCALLRSLVIEPSERGAGLGGKLVSYAERQAAASGVKTIYLLTTTADKFFQRLGYSSMSRAEAPNIITSTSQFSSLCPDSASFMAKQLNS